MPAATLGVLAPRRALQRMPTSMKQQTLGQRRASRGPASGQPLPQLKWWVLGLSVALGPLSEVRVRRPEQVHRQRVVESIKGQGLTDFAHEHRSYQVRMRHTVLPMWLPNLACPHHQVAYKRAAESGEASKARVPLFMPWTLEG